tara:strand:+ start:326 stop:790 length:465 start_codon:yes stop_codon:yes gene_type:complete
MANKNKSTLSPLAWILRWLLFIPHFLPFTAILFWHPDYWQTILALFIRKNGRGWNFFKPFWVRIPGIGLALLIVAWLTTAIINALSTMIPSIIFILIHGTLFLPIIFVPVFGIFITAIILILILAFGGKWPFISLDDLSKPFEPMQKVQIVDMA